MKKLSVHDISIHTKFRKNRSINEYFDIKVVLFDLV